MRWKTYLHIGKIITTNRFKERYSKTRRETEVYKNKLTKNQRVRRHKKRSTYIDKSIKSIEIRVTTF